MYVAFLVSCIQIRNLGTMQCVDSAARPEDNNKPAGLWPCHNQGGNQVRFLLHSGEDLMYFKLKKK